MMTSMLSFLVVIFVLVHVVADTSGGCAAAVWKENIYRSCFVSIYLPFFRINLLVFLILISPILSYIKQIP